MERSEPYERQQEMLYLGLIIRTSERGFSTREVFVFEVSSLFGLSVSLLDLLRQYIELVLVYIKLFVELYNFFEFRFLHGALLHAYGRGLGEHASAVVLSQEKSPLRPALAILVF
jgi:hypothetical protein